MPFQVFAYREIVILHRDGKSKKLQVALQILRV